MDKHGKIFKLSLAFCILHSIHGLRPFVIDMDAIDYEFNTDIIKFMHMKLIDYKGRKAINGTFAFAKDLHECNFNHWVTVPKARGKIFTLYNFTINGCEFLEGKVENVNLFARSYLQQLKQQIPDIPKRCPFKKNKDYMVGHFYLDEEMFPPYLPVVEFNAFMGLIQDNVYGFKLFLKANVKNTRKINL